MQAFKVAKIPSTLAPFPGSAHTQQFDSLSTPYDNWKDTDRQGFFIHKGKTVCSKCLNAENSSILSWENTTTCPRCLNTDHVTTSLNKPKRGRKRQMPNHNQDAYAKAFVDVKGKTIASQHENQHHQPVYYIPENCSSSIHIEGTSVTCQKEVNRCPPQSENTPINQIQKTARRSRQRRQLGETSSANNHRTSEGVSDLYIDLGDCECVCEYCGATLWYGERLKSHSQRGRVRYGKCCAGGQVYLRNETDPPPYLKELFRDKHFLDNVHAYNQMFSLIQTLDENNELVQVFRTARDKCNEGNVPEFKVQLYNVVATREYQLPSSGTLGAIVFEPDANSQTDFDMIIEYKDKQPKRINKLHSSYMSVQFPLLFVYGQPGYNTNLTLTGVNANRKRTKMVSGFDGNGRVPRWMMPYGNCSTTDLCVFHECELRTSSGG
ncbi:hypothetical protein CTI12_AA183800 [Artemisia annua]|uniref:Helitron helicase-like domain-containing protein n=1 Tax=Artemisia annua TaxID=35608 RepID=A0A2U1P7M1_ARTAN|nr:hypothetical protein CTI12_AA183800 [Artemisia annua]